MIISFPHLGDYYVPISVLFKLILPMHTVMPAPKTSLKTLELGSRHSPDSVCVPFKYNLGNFIEALENGAEVLVQAGGGCRYGYYAELQEQILKDLGYKFEFINLFDIKGNKIIGVLRIIRKLGCKESAVKIAYYVALTAKMLKEMDRLDFIVRKNIGFETESGSFQKEREKFLQSLLEVKTIRQLNTVVAEFEDKFNKIPVNKPEKGLMRVGMIGELYTLMDPFANYFMEKELAKNSIEIARFINMSYLVFDKSRKEPETVKNTKKYLKYTIGADGADSVARAIELSEKGFDGLIHVKPFACTPEVNAMPVLMNVSKDFKIPIIYFSFDSQTTQTGIKTRLEAFYDMLKMKKEEKLWKTDI